MAMPELDRFQIGERVRVVRQMANLSGNQLRKLLGSTDSNLVKDIEDGNKKIVDYLRLQQIAALCAGKGLLAEVSDIEILDYLTGRVNWDFRPRLVEPGSEPASRSSDL